MVEPLYFLARAYRLGDLDRRNEDKLDGVLSRPIRKRDRRETPIPDCLALLSSEPDADFRQPARDTPFKHRIEQRDHIFVRREEGQLPPCAADDSIPRVAARALDHIKVAGAS